MPENIWVINLQAQLIKLKPKEDRQCPYKRNIKARSRNHCCRVKARNITYFQFVSVALITQHAMRLRHTTLLSVAWQAIKYFCILPINSTIFKEKSYWICIVCCDFLCTRLCETFLILRRTEQDIIINVHRSSEEVPVIFVRLESNLNVSDRLLKNPQKSNLVKVSPVVDWVRAGRCGDRILMGARFSAPVQTGPGAHPASYTMDIVSLSRD
jgi:hypothetical protein